NYCASSGILSLSLHDALPIFDRGGLFDDTALSADPAVLIFDSRGSAVEYCENQLISASGAAVGEPGRVLVENSPVLAPHRRISGDRKSTRLNSSHGSISYAVF